MKTARFIYTVVVTMLLISAVYANAQDDQEITFNVPVEIRLAHQDVYSYELICAIYNDQNQKIGSGEGGLSVQPGTGDYSRTITIQARAEERYDIMDADHYIIELYVSYHVPRTDSDVGDVDHYENPDFGHPDPPARVREGTEFVGEVRGDINW